MLLCVVAAAVTTWLWLAYSPHTNADLVVIPGDRTSPSKRRNRTIQLTIAQMARAILC